MPFSQLLALPTDGKPISTWSTPGKLKSTDGIYGIRFAHNTDATVAGLTLSKQ
jgi:hypothetical protein